MVRDMTTRPLTPKQQRFVEEYLVDLNATQAAIRAGYSARNAGKLGPRLVGESRIAAAISAAMAARAEKVEVTAAEVLEELRTLMTSDVRHFQVDHDGTLTLAPGVPDRAWRAVSSVKHKIRTFTDDDGNTDTTREIEFRLWDKNTAIEKVAKHIRFYPPEKIEHSGEVKTGGVLVVPGAISPEQWAVAAEAQQAALVEQKHAMGEQYGVAR
jgi:phage terminase small subunit